MSWVSLKPGGGGGRGVLKKKLGTDVRLEISSTTDSKTTDELNLQPYQNQIFCFTSNIRGDRKKKKGGGAPFSVARPCTSHRAGGLEALSESPRSNDIWWPIYISGFFFSAQPLNVKEHGVFREA